MRISLGALALVVAFVGCGGGTGTGGSLPASSGTTQSSAPSTVPALSTTVLQYQNGSAAYPNGIAIGSDNNLWLTTNGDLNSGAINKITAGGVFTTYFLPTISGDYALPGGITSGPDNGLWFPVFSFGHNNLGRIDTSGNITYYPVPGSGGPIVTGSDGNLWFANGGSKIYGFNITSHTIVGSVQLPQGTYVNQLISNPANGDVLVEASNLPTNHSLTDYIYAFAPGPSPSTSTVYSSQTMPKGSLSVGNGKIYAIDLGAGSGPVQLVTISQSTYAQSSVPLQTTIPFGGGTLKTEYSGPTVVAKNGNVLVGEGFCANCSTPGIGEVTTAGVAVGQTPALSRTYIAAIIGPDGSAWFVDNSPFFVQTVVP